MRLALISPGRNGSTLPPGPRMPQSMQTIGWSQRPMPFMQRCQRRYGDMFTLRIRHAGEWVFLADPEHIKQVFTTDPSTLGAGVANTLLGPVLGPGSVMLMEEPAHMTRRRYVLPPFHGQRMLGYGEMIAEVARQEVSRWPVGEPFQLWPKMQAISLEVVMRAVFGSVETQRMKSLREMMRTLTGWMNNPHRLAVLAALGPRWLARNRGFMSVMGPVEETVLEEVRERRRDNHEDRGDIVSLLNQIRHEDGSPLSEKEMRDELVTLITDGPTSSSLAWAFERLTRHPEKLARLREEVLTSENGTPYLDAVVKEVLRLIPAVPVVIRKLLQPMEIGGYHLPAGVAVAPCIFLVHYREELYPRPRSFMPERFLEHPAGTYTWIPFGGGARRCIAANFAQYEMKQVMRTVLQEVELGEPVSRSERARRSAIAFAPDQRGVAVVTRRLAA